MYELYIANKNYSSWSLRPWLLMQQLDIAFQENLILFQDNNWDSFRTFSPTGKVPCLKVDEMIVWDSLAIVEFLAEHHAGVWPADQLARTWARCAAAEMHSGFSNLREMCPMNVSLKVQLAQNPAALQKDISRIDELWQEGLNRFGGEFLAGNSFTAVDAFFAPVALRVETYQLKLSEPALGYAARLCALPAVQEWIKAGRQEPRHEAHEVACLRYDNMVTNIGKR